MSKIIINTARPQFNDTVFIAPNAVVIGDVSLGDDVNIWYGACVRADVAPISIGAGSNIQDNATVHVDVKTPTVIGKRVTIGHNAVVHGATIGDDVLIGMGAIILNNALIGNESLVAAGTVVKEGMVIPPGSLVAGIPGKILKEITPEQQAHIRENGALYVECGKAFQLAEKE